MKNFSEYKEFREGVGDDGVEGQFNNVDLGRGSMDKQIQRFRRDLAMNLQDLLEDGEFTLEMTLQETIQRLQGQQ